MRSNSKSRMLLLELLLALFIFSACAMICAGVFFAASKTASESRFLTRAVFSAETAAEAFHATQDVEDFAAAMSGEARGEALIIPLEKDSGLAGETREARMEVTFRIDGLVYTAYIDVYDGDTLVYQLETAKYMAEVSG